MRRFSSWMLALGVLLVLALVAPTAANDDDDNGFGGSVAGTYVGEAFLGDLVLLHFVLQIHADGTWISTDDTDFGASSIGGFQSPIRGVWRKSGARQISLRGFSLIYNDAGELLLVLRVAFTVDFEKGLSQAMGGFSQEAFSPLQVLEPPDPNTEDAPDFGASGPFAIRMNRLVVP